MIVLYVFATVNPGSRESSLDFRDAVRPDATAIGCHLGIGKTHPMSRAVSTHAHALIPAMDEAMRMHSQHA